MKTHCQRDGGMSKWDKIPEAEGTRGSASDWVFVGEILECPAF